MRILPGRPKLAFAVVLLLGATVGGVQASAEEPPGAPVADVGAGAAAKAPGERGGRGRREAPKAMVLCRGPRGAVYARDVEDGCRNVQLDASNLVDFGAGDDCLLRKARAFDPKGQATSGARSCNDVCRAADENRSCVVALQHGDPGWTTFTAEKSFAAGDATLLDATVVCCTP